MWEKSEIKFWLGFSSSTSTLSSGLSDWVLDNEWENQKTPTASLWWWLESCGVTWWRSGSSVEPRPVFNVNSPGVRKWEGQGGPGRGQEVKNLIFSRALDSWIIIIPRHISAASLKTQGPEPTGQGERWSNKTNKVRWPRCCRDIDKIDGKLKLIWYIDLTALLCSQRNIVTCRDGNWNFVFPTGFTPLKGEKCVI